MTICENLCFSQENNERVGKKFRNEDEHLEIMKELRSIDANTLGEKGKEIGQLYKTRQLSPEN